MAVTAHGLLGVSDSATKCLHGLLSVIPPTKTGRKGVYNSPTQADGRNYASESMASKDTAYQAQILKRIGRGSQPPNFRPENVKWHGLLGAPCSAY